MAGDRSSRVKRPTMRRVVFYLSSLPAGGLERVTLTLMSAFIADGYAVDLLLERRSGSYLALIPKQVRCLELQTGSKWRACLRLIVHWPSEGLRLAARMLWRPSEHVPLARLESVCRYLDQAAPDVMFASAGRIPFLALWAKRLSHTRCRVVIAEHSTFTARLQAARDEPAAYKRMRYRQGLIARLYATADSLVAVSSGVADDLSHTANVARESIHVIHNPVVTDELREKAELEPSHPWCRDADLDVILAAGRLAPEKGFDRLIGAFARLTASRPALRLLIVGEGPERCVLASKIAELGLADRVALPGWADNPYALMSHSRVFVLSSLFEGLPVALIEALACGCKVVASDCPSGPREILDNGRYGELVPVGHEPALAEAIAAELVRERSRAALIERGRDFAAGPAVASYRTLIDDLMRRDARVTVA